MTPGELKFALCVEAALNRIPEPEYRQLVVEMLMVLSLVIEYHPEQTLGDTIDVDELVFEGHNLYLKDQVIMSRNTVLHLGSWSFMRLLMHMWIGESVWCSVHSDLFDLFSLFPLCRPS